MRRNFVSTWKTVIETDRYTTFTLRCTYDTDYSRGLTPACEIDYSRVHGKPAWRTFELLTNRALRNARRKRSCTHDSKTTNVIVNAVPSYNIVLCGAQISNDNATRVCARLCANKYDWHPYRLLRKDEENGSESAGNRVGQWLFVRGGVLIAHTLTSARRVLKMSFKK